MTALLKTNSPPSKGASIVLPGAYRRPLRKGGRCYIYWYESREPGAEQLARFAGKTMAEAEAAEKAGAADLAARYADLLKPRAHPGFMLSLIRDFETHEFPKLSPTTRKVWRGHMAKIEIVFGETSLRAMQRKGARQLIKRWHEGMGAQPRTANYRLTVLTRLLNWGVDEERLARNPAAGIRRLDEGPGRAAITWSAHELEAFLRLCTPHVARGVRLAALTGMRLGDVVDLNWSDIEADVIRRPTAKSRRKQRASIALYPALRTLLDECPKVGPKVITNSRNAPWKSGDSFDSSLRPAINAFRQAGGADKHFHDLRGTACTFMVAGGLTSRQIALALGWSEREVENRINDYADLDAVARAMAAAHG
jgi:integrase